MQLHAYGTLAIAAFILCCVVVCIAICIVRKLRQKRRARATEDIELGVIVPEGASRERGIEVDRENEPRGCHIEVSAEEEMSYIDSESSGSEVSSADSADGRVRHTDSDNGQGGSSSEREKCCARATDDIELGVIVPEDASRKRDVEVDCENELGGCRTEISCKNSAEEDISYIDSEDTPGGSESENSADGRVGHIDSGKEAGGSCSEVVLHAFAEFVDDIIRDLMNMARMKRGGTVVINHWIPPSYDEMLRRPTPNTTMRNKRYEYGALSRIFDTSRKGHDGAVIIDLFNEASEEFLPTVRCCGFTFPINEVPVWDVNASDQGIGGMRRSSALCMSSYTNCSIFVVSEDEGGSVSHFRTGKRHCDLTSEDIRHFLEQAYQRAYVLKENEWPHTSSDVLAERTTLCERTTTKYAKYTFDSADHARAFWECAVQSHMAIRKNTRIEDSYHVLKSESLEAARQNRRRGLFDKSISALFEEVWRKTRDNDEWPYSDCLLLAFFTVANRAGNDVSTKCEMLAFGPLPLGALVYRIANDNEMVLSNMPDSRPDLYDHLLHFTVEILCKKVHDCRTIVWLIAPELEKFLLPQLEALKATRNNELREKYSKWLFGHDVQVFTCEVKDYYAPEHIRRK